MFQIDIIYADHGYDIFAIPIDMWLSAGPRHSCTIDVDIVAVVNGREMSAKHATLSCYLSRAS